MKTASRDETLLAEIADYFDMLASDCEACAARGIGSKTRNRHRAQALRDAASDVRSIEIIKEATQ